MVFCDQKNQDPSSSLQVPDGGLYMFLCLQAADGTPYISPLDSAQHFASISPVDCVAPPYKRSPRIRLAGELVLMGASLPRLHCSKRIVFCEQKVSNPNVCRLPNISPLDSAQHFVIISPLDWVDLFINVPPRIRHAAELIYMGASLPRLHYSQENCILRTKSFRPIVCRLPMGTPPT